MNDFTVEDILDQKLQRLYDVFGESYIGNLGIPYISTHYEYNPTLDSPRYKFNGTVVSKANMFNNKYVYISISRIDMNDVKELINCLGYFKGNAKLITSNINDNTICVKNDTPNLEINNKVKVYCRPYYMEEEEIIGLHFKAYK